MGVILLGLGTTKANKKVSCPFNTFTNLWCCERYILYTNTLLGMKHSDTALMSFDVMGRGKEGGGVWLGMVWLSAVVKDREPTSNVKLYLLNLLSTT